MVLLVQPFEFPKGQPVLFLDVAPLEQLLLQHLELTVLFHKILPERVSLLLKSAVLFCQLFALLLQGGSVALSLLQFAPKVLQFPAVVAINLTENLSDTLPLGSELIQLQPVIFLQNLYFAVGVALRQLC